MRVARSGFTLLELVIVLVVGGILSGVALSQMGRNAARQEARNARDAFVILASRARAAAIESGGIVRLELDVEDDSARVLPGRSGESTPIDSKSFWTEHGVRVTATGNAETLTVCYSPRGYALDSCSTIGNAEVTLTFQRDDHASSAVVRPLGQVERR